MLSGSRVDLFLVSPIKWGMDYMGHGLPRGRAFVIQLSAEAEPVHGSLVGRVEHIESGQSERFASSEAMNEFLARVLREEERHEKELGGSIPKPSGRNGHNEGGENE